MTASGNLEIEAISTARVLRATPAQVTVQIQLVRDRLAINTDSAALTCAQPQKRPNQLRAQLPRRLTNLQLVPGPLTWRENSGLCRLTALPVTFSTN